MNAGSAPYRAGRVLTRTLAAAVAFGVFVFVVGALWDSGASGGDPATPAARAWAGLLAGFHLVVALGLAGTLFLSLLDCSGAVWAAPLRRVPEAMSRALAVAVLPAAVLLFGVPTLFEWASPHAHDDPLLGAKLTYLDPGFLALRTGVFLSVWIWIGRCVRSAPPGAARVRWGAAATAVFGVTYSLMCVDWMQSLEPHWYSTAFALVQLAGLALSGLAAAIVIAVHLRRSGPWRGVLRTDHLHDLGKLLFGFSLFWSYLHYSQYMLIWYTNLPEETVWYTRRLEGMWHGTGVVSFVLNGAVPFVLLLFRRIRRSETGLLRVALLVLVGRFADLFFHIGPPLLGTDPSPSLWEVAPAVGLGALWSLATLRSLERAARAEPGEPGIAEAMRYHS